MNTDYTKDRNKVFLGLARCLKKEGSVDKIEKIEIYDDECVIPFNYLGSSFQVIIEYHFSELAKYYKVIVWKDFENVQEYKLIKDSEYRDFYEQFKRKTVQKYFQKDIEVKIDHTDPEKPRLIVENFDERSKKEEMLRKVEQKYDVYMFCDE